MLRFARQDVVNHDLILEFNLLKIRHSPPNFFPLTSIALT
jgi:hypothetical protein